MIAERTERPSTFSIIVQSANPIFIILSICLPIGALVGALVFDSLMFLNFVHIMTGGLWTGIDLFMGFVLGPVLGSMEPRERAAVFKRLVPKMTFLMPVIAAVTSTAGVMIAQRFGMFSLSNWRILAAVVITLALTIQGFGQLLPNEIRVFQQLVSPTPDIEKISRLGMRNAKLGAVQGIFQLAIIFIMANIRL